jgi:hypothetical protein
MAIVEMAYNREASSILVRPEDPEASVLHGREFLQSQEFRKPVRVALPSANSSAVRNVLHEALIRWRVGFVLRDVIRKGR